MNDHDSDPTAPKPDVEPKPTADATAAGPDAAPQAPSTAPAAESAGQSASQGHEQQVPTNNVGPAPEQGGPVHAAPETGGAATGATPEQGGPVPGPGGETPMQQPFPPRAGPLPPAPGQTGAAHQHAPPPPGGMPPPPPGAQPYGAGPHTGQHPTVPPLGPRTGQMPMAGGPGGPPPMGPYPGGQQPAPRPKKSSGLLVGALVIALGAGAAGGAVGYTLSGLGDSSASSSPSDQIADGKTISDIAKKVQPSVVSIATENSGGSGVVYDDEGHIITNNHVAETAGDGKLDVTFADGNTAKASVVGTDPAGDQAVLKVDDAPNLTPINMGDSRSLDVGDTVLAIGSPLGLDGSVTSGIVSALDRTVQAGGGEQGGKPTTLNGLVQTDAAINPGNSGGALVNGKGELVGINTVIATTGGSEGSVGLGFAIPSDSVKSGVEQIIEGGDVEHAFMGVSVTDNVGDDKGAVVSEVQGDSPAEKAGLKRGDFITKIDDTTVENSNEVGAVVQKSKPGAKVDVAYTRDGKDASATVELGSTAD